MKKYLILFAVALTMVMSAVVTTSCEEKITEGTSEGYSGTGTVEIFDLKGELTDVQKKDLEAAIKNISKFNVPYVREEATFKKYYTNWIESIDSNIIKFISSHSEVLNTSAGIRMVVKDASSTTSNVVLFKSYEEK